MPNVTLNAKVLTLASSTGRSHISRFMELRLFIVGTVSLRITQLPITKLVPRIARLYNDVAERHVHISVQFPLTATAL